MVESEGKDNQNFWSKRGIEMTVWGYARVSTKGQKAHGNSLEEQEQRLRENGASSVTVEQFSGASMERPKLQGLLGRMEAGDVLIVTKLDRLARNVEEGIHVIRSLIDRGVKVNVLNVGLLDQTPMGKFFITTLLAVAELERSMILERMQEGKAIARTKQGFREGRPPIDRARKEHALALLREGRSYKDVAAVTNLSVSTLSRYVRENGGFLRRKNKCKEDSGR